MSLASRTFNKKQALEKEIKDVYAKLTIGTPTAPTASFAVTTPVVMTKSSVGTVANVGTVTLHVSAAAANPTDTILCNVTGTASAISITIVPNDGTNNAATPVPLTTAELAELLSTGVVVGKTVTITDTGSLLANIASATGGDATNLAHSGEGDGQVATWAGAVDGLVNSSTIGIASVARNGVGDFSVVLTDRFHRLRNFKAIRVSSTAADINFQLKSEAVATTKEVRFLTLTAGSPVDPAAGVVILVKLELKNSST